MTLEPALAPGLRLELQQAEARLTHHIGERKHHDDEIARWREIVDGLKNALALIESPSTAIRKKSESANDSGAPKKRIRWDDELPKVIQELAARNARPTKRQLMVEIRARFQLLEATAQQTVYKAISQGKIIVKLDLCYLPGEVK